MSNAVHVFVSRGVIQHPVAYSLLLVLTKTNALISFQIAAEVHLLVFGPVDLVVAVSPFEWVPEQLSRFLTDPTLAKLLEHPGQ